MQEETTIVPFGERLSLAAERRATSLVLGLDPDPARLWPGTEPRPGSAPDPGALAASAVRVHCQRLIDATAEHCVAVKLQLACFERLGPAGWAALHDVAADARAAGLLVIADGKRGDIDVTADAYGAALFGGHLTPWGAVPGLRADAVTVNPWMGRDAIEPFIARAREVGGGVFVLVRTSNPGARDLQERRDASGTPAWASAAHLANELSGGGDQLSDVGAVCGATAPERVAEVRALMPRSPLLLPGVGAQGGRIEDLAPAWAPGPGGGLVTVSRAVARAHEQTGGDPAEAAREAAARLRDACAAVQGAA